jgi:multiple sugar transport system permease protein
MRLSTALLLTPAIALSILTVLYPLATSVYISLHDLDITGWVFVGPKHYAEMLLDRFFYQALVTSVVYTVLSVTSSLLLGVLAALLVHQLVRGRVVVETLFIIPLAVSPILGGIVWSPPAVWDDLNSFLHYAFSLPLIDVTDPVIYFPVMVLSETWLWSPLFMLATLVILDGFPRDGLEAAEVMGASRRHVLQMLYLPAVFRSRVIAMLVALKSVDFFRSFEIPFAWSFWVRESQLGAPTDTLSLMLFKMLLTPSTSSGIPIPYISAVSTALMAVSLVVSLLMYRQITRIWGGMR